MSKDYFINEGNKIGYMPTVLSSTGALTEKKLVADGDIAKGQLVEVSDDLTVKVATAGSAAVMGVAMFDAKDGEPVAVESEGLFYLIASANISAGAVLSAAANGAVVTQTAGSQLAEAPYTYTAPTPKVGIAISDGVKDGEVIVKFSI